MIILVLVCTACGKKDDLNNIALGLSEYTINVDFNNDTKTAKCSQNVAYVNGGKDILREVKFHLYPQFFEEGATDYILSSTKYNTAYPNGMSYAEFDITRVLVEGTDIGIVYEGECDGILNVPLNNSLIPDDVVEIEIEFEFSLPNCHHRFGYGDDTINLGNFYPIACVYEEGGFNINPYNANGDPFYSDMANYCVNLTTDSSLIVAGTGEKSVAINADNSKYTFTQKAVRDFAMVMSEHFEIISSECGDTTIEYYHYGDESVDASLKAGVDAIKTFSKLFGDYPYKTFSIVKTDFVHGGMEYPTLIMISDEVENVDDYLNVIIHETAHQWWYGVVGNDEYEYPWLDEALTEYSTILFYDYNDGYNLSHEDMVNASKENYTLFVTVYKDVLGDIDTSMRAVDEYNTEPEYTYCTYVKGVLMFDSLYSLVGEKDFIESLETYYETHKYANATPKDLVSCFELICDTDLNSFFSSWVDGKVVVR